ncbi:MAG: four helix bundle protein [Bacteroidota bacterium]|nr:four helix bundle protein [Bacteroidota bacterium]
MTSEDLKKRTKVFSIGIIYLTRLFPKNDEGFTIKKQIIRSATSVAANYRAVCRARSSRDFISKMAIVEEESDETLFWLEVAIEIGLVTTAQGAKLSNEANQLTAIFSASRKTARTNNGK